MSNKSIFEAFKHIDDTLVDIDGASKKKEIKLNNINESFTNKILNEDNDEFKAIIHYDNLPVEIEYNDKIYTANIDFDYAVTLDDIIRAVTEIDALSNEIKSKFNFTDEDIDELNLDLSYSKQKDVVEYIKQNSNNIFSKYESYIKELIKDWINQDNSIDAYSKIRLFAMKTLLNQQIKMYVECVKELNNSNFIQEIHGYVNLAPPYEIDTVDADNGHILLDDGIITNYQSFYDEAETLINYAQFLLEGDIMCDAKWLCYNKNEQIIPDDTDITNEKLEKAFSEISLFQQKQIDLPSFTIFIIPSISSDDKIDLYDIDDPYYLPNGKKQISEKIKNAKTNSNTLIDLYEGKWETHAQCYFVAKVKQK